MVRDHEAYPAARALVLEHRPGIAAHALLETYSVVTRMPAVVRITPTAAHSQLAKVFPDVVDLPAAQRRGLLRSLASRGIAGGAVYDALVGLTALSAKRQLVTRDRRALATYTALGVDVRFLT